jgi:hypothetical protein
MGKTPNLIGIDQPASVVFAYAGRVPPKKPFMGSPPEIPCALCSKPVNLGSDLCADENGNAVQARSSR